MKADRARWLRCLQATALLLAPAVAIPAALVYAGPAAPLHAPAAPPPAPVPGPGPTSSPAAPVAPPAEPTLQERVQATLNQDEAALRNLNSSPTQREEAARRLMFSRVNTPQHRPGDDRVLRALQDDHPAVVQAVGRAVADDPTPDPRLIDRFLVHLGPGDRATATTEAAAMALAAYREDPKALGPLLRYAGTPAPGLAAHRAAAVRALGAVPAQPVAAQLMSLLANDREPLVREAAAEALAHMTGLREHGRDVTAWRQWWNVQGRVNALQFKAALVDRRAGAHAAVADLDAAVRDLYRLAGPAARPDALLRVLNSPDAALRAAGVRLIVPEATNAGRVPAGTHPRLSEMISDSSAEVRAEVALTVSGRGINYAPAQDGLMVQLAQEPDPTVRVAILKALDARPAAVPVIRDLLNDPSLRVATAAAETLAKVNHVIHADAALRKDVIADLRRALDGRARQPDAGEFRAACIEALVSLAGRPDDNRLAPLFFEMLDPAENERARKALLRGIGAAGDNRHATRVLQLLANEPVPEVRVAGYQAMGEIGAFSNSKEILEGIKPAERDESVRAAAWEAFVRLLPKAPSTQALVELKDVTFKGQPARRLPVLKELEKRQRDAGELRELALTQEDTGGTYMQLGMPKDAINSFRAALDFWLAQPAVPPRVLHGLITNLMDALLVARQFPEAVKFAQQMIARDPGVEPNVASKITDMAETLLDQEKKRGEALQLVNEAQKMNPPLGQLFADRLAAIKARAEAAAPPPQPLPPTPQPRPAPPPQ